MSGPAIAGSGGRAALILFGHGARDPDWAIPLLKIRAALRESHPASPVALAFLEFQPPTLNECIAGLRDEGILDVTVLPIFIARSGHLKRDLVNLVEGLREQYPDVAIAVAPAIGEAPEVIAAMASHAGVLLDGGAVPLSADD